MVEAGAVADPMAPAAGKGDGQPEHKGHDQEDEHRRRQGLEHREDQHLPPVLPQPGEPEILPHAESDEGQGHVGDEIHPLDHVLRDQVQEIGPDENAGQNVPGDVGQPDQLGQPGH